MSIEPVQFVYTHILLALNSAQPHRPDPVLTPASGKYGALIFTCAPKCLGRLGAGIAFTMWLSLLLKNAIFFTCAFSASMTKNRLPQGI